MINPATNIAPLSTDLLLLPAVSVLMGGGTYPVPDGGGKVYVELDP